MTEKRKYDIALSFAGEERDYVDRAAHLLREHGVSVFYDLFEEADLWGKDLYEHLSEVYLKRAQFTVMFISQAYANKRWTNHERKSAQARAFQDASEYILPARFDDTVIPGVLPTVGYVSLQGRSPEQLVSLITKKLISSGGSVPTELVRGDFSSPVPTKSVAGGKFSVTVSDDEGTPLQGCEVGLQAPNGTSNTISTGNDGVATFELKVRRLSTLLVSHPNFPAGLYEKVDTDARIEIILPRMDNIGSITIYRSGYIPGLIGRLNPIIDSLNRTYLYADNIAIDDGKVQPVNFVVNVPFKLVDADGSVVYANVKHIIAGLSLIQYTRQPVD